MAEDRDVPRDVVMAVLRHHKVLVSDVDGHITLVKDSTVETLLLPDKYISYRMLQRFQWKYNVPIHHFYHPEALIEPKPGPS